MEEAFAKGLPTVAEFEAAEEEDVIRKEADDEYHYTKADSIKEVWLDFVKYHLQSNAVFIDGGSKNKSGVYESGKTELTPAVEVAEGVAEEDLVLENGKYVAVTIKGVQYEIKSNSTPAKDADGTYSVEYYTGLYSPGTPYRLTVNVSSSGLSVTDNSGNTAHVLTEKGLYNMMATEYWINADPAKKNEMHPYEQQLANYSFAVIHAIDHPLIYSKDKKTVDGKEVPAQFVYTRKPLAVTTSAKRR